MISIGIAMVSNGTISVAMMTASTTSRPRHFMNTKAKAASEQTKSDSTTVTPVTSTELKMKVADRRPLEGAEVVVERDVPDRQEGAQARGVGQQLRVRLQRRHHHEEQREDEDHRPEDQERIAPGPVPGHAPSMVTLCPSFDGRHHFFSRVR